MGCCPALGVPWLRCNMASRLLAGSRPIHCCCRRVSNAGHSSVRRIPMGQKVARRHRPVVTASLTGVGHRVETVKRIPAGSIGGRVVAGRHRRLPIGTEKEVRGESMSGLDVIGHHRHPHPDINAAMADRMWRLAVPVSLRGKRQRHRWKWITTPLGGACRYPTTMPAMAGRA